MKITGQKKGFTIVEIMTVVTIIGILGSIAVPNVLKAVQKAKVKKAETDLEMIAAAVKQLAWDTQKIPVPEGNSYRIKIVGVAHNLSSALAPTTVANGWGDEVTNLNADLAGLVTGSNFPNWKGPYIESVPLDPWGSTYIFDPDYTLLNAGSEVGRKVNTYVAGQSAAVVHSRGPNKSDVNVYNDGDNIFIILSKIYAAPNSTGTNSWE